MDNIDTQNKWILLSATKSVFFETEAKALPHLINKEEDFARLIAENWEKTETLFSSWLVLLKSVTSYDYMASIS